MAELRGKGIEVQGEPVAEGFGITVMLTLPGQVEVLLYEPRHEVAIPNDGRLEAHGNGRFR